MSILPSPWPLNGPRNYLAATLDITSQVYQINVYADVARLNGTIVLRIDGTLPVKDIQKIIYTYVKKYLKVNKTPKRVKNKISPQGLSRFIKIDEENVR